MNVYPLDLRRKRTPPFPHSLQAVAIVLALLLSLANPGRGDPPGEASPGPTGRYSVASIAPAILDD